VLLGVGLVVGVIVIGLAVAVHHPGVQQRVWGRVQQVLSDAGVEVDSDIVRARLVRPRIELSGVRIRAGERTVATVESLEVRFRWNRVLRAPRHLDAIEIDGLWIDPIELASLAPAEESDRAAAGGIPWRAVEIGRLEVADARIGSEIAGVGFTVAEVSLSGRILDGAAQLEGRAGDIVLTRQGRTLLLGPLRLGVFASEREMRIDRLELDGTPLGFAASATGDPRVGKVFGEGHVHVDLEPVLGWWDPNLITGLGIRGRLDMSVAADHDPDRGLEVSAEHTGGVLRIAGYDVDRLRIERTPEVANVEIGSATWGEATAVVPAKGPASIEARLAGAPLGPGLAFAVGPLPGWVPGPMSASGEVSATVPYPLDLELLEAEADVSLTFPDGRVALRGRGRGLEWHAESFGLKVPGASATGTGRLLGDGSLEADASLTLEDVPGLMDYAERWAPEIAALDIGGDRADAVVRIAGTLDRPTAEIVLELVRPRAAGVTLDRIEAWAGGSVDALDWRLMGEIGGDARLDLSGTVDVAALELEGGWHLDVPDVSTALSGVAPGLAERLEGAVRGEGTFAGGPDEWRVDGVLASEGLAFDEWTVDTAELSFGASPTAFDVEWFETRLLGGAATGSARIAPVGLDGEIDTDVEWRGIDPARLPFAAAEAAGGSLEGSIRVAGTVRQPETDLELRWTGGTGADLVRSGSLRATLADGEIRLISDGLDTAAGPLMVTGSLPLGDVPRPEWLWPGAPRGALELTALGSALELGNLATALGREQLPVQPTSDVTLQVRWSPVDPADRFGLLQLDQFSLRHAGGVVTAPEGIRVRLDRDVVVLERTRLVAPRAVVDVAGIFDNGAREIGIEVDGELAPEIAGLIPYPVQIDRPITIRGSVEGPLEAPEGTIVVDHRGGTVVLRDPPLELTDLHLEADLRDGEISITEGTAGVNRGVAYIGGGWDVETGQGLVMEFEDVTFFAAGTLTRWSGLLAVEPDSEKTARITGDLVLGGGVWDQYADITGALLAGAGLEPAADDPLHGIALDLTVRARTGVRVDNNLGRFDVRWDRLRVGGTAAAPVIRGDIRIAPGGVVNLPGKSVELQRGTIRFTGDSAVDPVLELVPVESVATFGGQKTDETGSGFDAYAIAAQSLYGGIGRALGFENETLQPAEIAVETETDTSSQFLLGQRLSPNLAFFFAANPTDVQDRTTTLQLWNLQFDPGLAVQAYQKTLEETSGVNVIQRFRWGGSAGRVGLGLGARPSGGAGSADRPVIQKVKLEGEWPISKRRLRRATGLRKGRPYDPFLDFVADLKLEQELAAAGYPEARVQGRTEGPAQAPTVVYTCDPGPRYQIDFTGDIPPKAVQREVRALYMPPPLDATAIEGMRQNLVRHFRASGFPFAEVEVAHDGDRVVFEIGRGERLKYRGPVVEGVPARGARLIQDVLGSPAELAGALEDPARTERIVNGLLSGIGYTEARLVEVTSERVEEKEEQVRLVVDPGELTEIAEVEVVGSDPLGLTDELGEALAPGAPLDRRAMDDRMAEIRRAYQQSGYDQVSVRSVPHLREDGSWLVRVEIEPGMQRTLADVEFSGLRHIKPRYLRTGLELAEGDLLDVFEVDESAIRIANFAPVERLELTTRAVGAGGSVVDLEVFEKPRWTVEFGAGWDRDRGFEARTGLRDDNLFGRGVSANLRLRFNDIEKVALLYGSLPPLPGRKISFGSTLGYELRDRELDLPNGDTIPYTEKEALASLDLNYQVAPYSTLKPYLRFTRTELDYETEFIGIDLDETIVTTTIGAAAFRDRFDNPFDPRSGYSLVGDVGWSTSYLGSDLDTLQAVAGASLAIEPLSDWTWVQTLRFGAAEPLRGSVLDPTVKFKAGGQGSIRGFDRDSVGPVGVGGEPVGGGALFILNEELRVPVWGSLRGAVFADVGQVWESWGTVDGRLAVGAGLGLRWSTPIGLVWGDVAWPVANLGISSSNAKFYLGVGRPF
jgi:outer membrane protein assembly factor BamA